MIALQNAGEKLRNFPNLGSIFREFDVRARNSPISNQQFERLLAQVDASIKSAYQSQGAGEPERKAAELQIFIRGEIPPIFAQSVSQLLFTTLTSLKEEINEADLYFLDISDLALTNDAYARKKNQKYPIDVNTKIRLKTGSKLRRCTKCCSLTEEVTSNKPSSIKVRLTRLCICGSYFMQLDEEDRAAVQVEHKEIAMPTQAFA